MGTLTVNFVGICTHFSQNVPVPHRVVLVNATAAPTVMGVPIPPHFPTISIASSGAFPLTGVSISVQNPAATPVGPLPSDVANLTSLMSPIETLAVLSPQLVLDQISQFAACYFDIATGTFSTFNSNGNLAVRLVMDTVATPESPNGDPLLLFTPFPNAPPLATGLTSPMLLASGTTITVSNEAPPADETGPGSAPSSHFLLHYLTATQMPGAPQVPPMPSLIIDSVGGGCSNSNYP